MSRRQARVGVVVTAIERSVAREDMRPPNRRPEGMTRYLASTTPPAHWGQLGHDEGKPASHKAARPGVGFSDGKSEVVNAGKFELGATELELSFRASARISKSFGHGETNVYLDPRTKSISVDHGRFSFTDEGNLHKIGRPWQNAYKALTETPPKRVTDPYSLAVSLGKRSYSTRVGHVEISKSVDYEGGKPTIIVELSSAVSVSIPGHGKAELQYSLAADVQIDHKARRTSPVMVTEETFALALLAIGVYALRPRVGSGGP